MDYEKTKNEKWSKFKFSLFFGERKPIISQKAILTKKSIFILKMIKFHKITLLGCRSI